jgi:4-aminobutyrate aminotransferase-like enzyme/Ser/Thr protein kinase RdoA (MazF antagonist)
MQTRDRLDDREAGGPLAEPPPRVSLGEASALVAEMFGVEGRASRLDSERDANFRIEGDDAYVLKVYNSAEAEAVVEMQAKGMLHVAAVDPALPVPRLVTTREGKLYGSVLHESRSHAVHLITFLEGVRAEPVEFDVDALRAFGTVAARVGRALRGFFHPAAQRSLIWDVKHAARLRPLLDFVDDPARVAVAARALDRFDEQIVPRLASLRAQVIHNDLTHDNVLVGPDLRATAIVDFGDMTHSPLLFDLAVALASFCAPEDLFDRVEAFVGGYGEVTPLEEIEAELLAEAASARMTASVLISAWRVGRFPENTDYITAFDERTWAVLELLDELGPQELRRRFRAAASTAVFWSPRASTEFRPSDELVERRRRAFGPAMGPLTYERPVHFVRGEGVWMIDAEGRRYLDAYNNVPIVGHSHPRVVSAIATQARLLNTNTRYLHELALELAERLTTTLPASLDTCLFVNSGSEANELAWRFATAVTGASGALVSEWAYHGVTAVQADLSPSEWTEDMRPSYVETVPAPDGYRGAHRRDEAGWQLRYGECVSDAVAALGRRGARLAAMFCDSAWTSDGIFTDAATYLSEATSAARETGGLFVADEVQAGFGRFGSHMWSFEPAGIEPDFVTLGKPMGNGHPVAAVITSRPIAEEFARRRPPLFSTFGGNPVSCAAALAVLDVIAEEQLLERVAEVGTYLRAGLDELAGRHEAVGDVRGTGLLLGVDLVEDRETRAPARETANQVVNGLRERAILVGLTGRAENVLKIRPPLVFGREHAERLIETLDDVLTYLGAPRPAGAASTHR